MWEKNCSLICLIREQNSKTELEHNLSSQQQFSRLKLTHNIQSYIKSFHKYIIIKFIATNLKSIRSKSVETAQTEIQN